MVQRGETESQKLKVEVGLAGIKMHMGQEREEVQTSPKMNSEEPMAAKK